MAISKALLIIMCFISLSDGASDTQKATTLAASGEFPHMVVIGRKNNANKTSYGCAGSLIDSKFVLTAGHCTSQLSTPAVILLGVLDVDDKGSEAQEMTVKKIHTHPDYKLQNYYNDITIIELEHAPSFNKNVAPACISKQSEVDISSLIGSGWKFPFRKPDASSPPEDSRLLNKYNLSDDKCDLSVLKDGRKLPNGLADYHICLKSPSMVSGSVIQIPSKTGLCNYDVYAFTAFGKDNQEVYTKTSHFYDWIKSITTPK